MYAFAEAAMNVIKVNKRIESGNIHIEGLEKYIGKDAEIIVLIEDPVHDDLELRKKKADKFIASCSGKINKWDREELHER